MSTIKMFMIVIGVLFSSLSCASTFIITNSTGELLNIPALNLCSVGKGFNASTPYGPYPSIPSTKGKNKLMFTIEYGIGSCPKGAQQGASVQFQINNYDQWCDITGQQMMSDANIIIEVYKGKENFPKCDITFQTP